MATVGRDAGVGQGSFLSVFDPAPGRVIIRPFSCRPDKDRRAPRARHWRDIDHKVAGASDGSQFGSETVAKKLLSLLAAILLLAGCASAPKPLAPETLAYFESKSALLRSSGVSIVGDGCILSVGMSRTFAYQDESLDFAKAAAAVLTDYLKSSGIKVRSVVVPFLCGGLLDASGDFRVAQDEESDDEVVQRPVVLSDRLRQNASLTAAYAELTMRSHGLPLAVPPVAAGQQPSPYELSEKSRRALMKDLGSRYVFLIHAGGGQVSGARRFFSGFLTGVATGLLTGGLAVVRMDVSHTAHLLTVLDLERGEALWRGIRSFPTRDPMEAARGKEVAPWAGDIAAPFIQVAQAPAPRAK